MQRSESSKLITVPRMLRCPRFTRLSMRAVKNLVFLAIYTSPVLVPFSPMHGPAGMGASSSVLARKRSRP